MSFMSCPSHVYPVTAHTVRADAESFSAMCFLSSREMLRSVALAFAFSERSKSRLHVLEFAFLRAVRVPFAFGVR